MSLNLKKIITNFKKYHYFILNKNKIISLGKSNSNTKAKMDALEKLKKKSDGERIIHRVKFSKSKNINNTLIKIDDSIPVYIEIREYVFLVDKIKPKLRSIDINVFLRKKYLIKGINLKDIKLQVKKYIKNKLSGNFSELNFLG
tara:strand:- start:1268 stop:1699 length:432 start_codon:yes stop_codon:yes gene_type:complete